MTKTLTVTYKVYHHLFDVPDKDMPRLAKLTLGEDHGMMYDVVHLHMAGYCREEWPAVVLDTDQLDLHRVTVVAYVRNVPVGWATMDTSSETKFNVYVAPKYRKLGIAQTLTTEWVRNNIEFVTQRLAARGHTNLLDNLVYTDAAAKLMANALIILNIQPAPNRKKFRKVIHKVLGGV